jgi:hypothetical protein
MTLAAILGFCLIGLTPGPSLAMGTQAGWSAKLVPRTAVIGFTSSASQDQGGSTGGSQTTQHQTPPSEPSTAPASPSQSTPTKSSPSAQPAAKRRKRHSSDAQHCSPAGTSSAGNKAAGSAQAPCSPSKVVVKDGGSNEPAVQLKGASNEQQERSTTEQITTATEDNLKKVAGRPLDASQQQTLSQVKQFLEQSKAAIAEGDLERGHDLAMKARLLSDELVKP